MQTRSMKRKAEESLVRVFKCYRTTTPTNSLHDGHMVEQTARDALTQWCKQVRRECRVVEIQRWWRRVYRNIPVNPYDALTLERVKVHTPPDDGGKWFEIVTEDGHRIRYAANTLFSYLISQHTHIEPLHRKPLTRTELSRLDGLIENGIRDEHQGKYATHLLNAVTIDRRKQEDMNQEIAFFLEDDIKRLLQQIADSVKDVHIHIANSAGNATVSGEFLDHMKATLQGVRRRIEMTNALHEMHATLNDLKAKSEEDAARVVKYYVAPRLKCVAQQIGQTDPDLAFDILCQLEVWFTNETPIDQEERANEDGETATSTPGLIYMDITESWSADQSSSAETLDELEGVAPYAYTFQVLSDAIDMEVNPGL